MNISTLIQVLFICIAVSVQASFSQRVFTLIGTVKDSVTGSPISDVSVIIAGTTAGSSADTAGRFIIPRVSEGRNTLLLRHIAYYDVTIDVPIRTDADTTIVDVVMRPTVVPLPGVTALGERSVTSFRDSVYKRWARVTVSAKQLEEEGLIDFDQFLDWHASFARGEFDLFVDGSRFPLDLLDNIKIRNIKQIFVWRRVEAPVEFRYGHPPLESRSPRGRTTFSSPFVIKPYVILVQTK